MRILILVHGYPPTHTAGAELRANRTARTLAELGHCVRVICVESTDVHAGHPPYLEIDEDGVLVRRLFLAQPEVGRPLSWEHDDPATARALSEMLDIWRPDAIHLFSGYRMTSSVVWEARTRGVPVVLSLTDFWWLCHRINLLRADGSRCDGPTPTGCARCHGEMYRRFRLPKQLWRQPADALWRLSSQNARLGSMLKVPHFEERLMSSIAALNVVDALIAPSQYLADVYMSYGVEPSKIHIWRQGIEIDRCPVRTTAGHLRVAYLGQVKYHKGVDLLLDAWGMLRGSTPRKLVIYGSDKGEAAYGELLRRELNNLHDVTWSEPVPRDAIWALLANLDVVVVPSRWVENSPNVILEAQAMGVVVIGTNLGGVAEMVCDEVNGLLFDADDAAHLAHQLQRLLDDPDLLPRLRAGHTPFHTHLAEIERIESLYESVVSVPDRRQAGTELVI